nr:unnamed protein product [Callosobruchus analis]
MPADIRTANNLVHSVRNAIFKLRNEELSNFLGSLLDSDMDLWRIAKSLRSKGREKILPLQGENRIVYLAEKVEAFGDLMEEQFSPNEYQNGDIHEAEYIDQYVTEPKITKPCQPKPKCCCDRCKPSLLKRIKPNPCCVKFFTIYCWLFMSIALGLYFLLGLVDNCVVDGPFIRPCGENHPRRQHLSRSGGGGTPCITPSVIGAIRTCRDIFDKLCIAADNQATPTCSCCNSVPRYQQQRECCCCREHESPVSYRVTPTDADICICEDDAASTTTSTADEDEVVKTDKATSALTIPVGIGGGVGGGVGGQSIAASDLTNERVLEVISETDTPHEQQDYAAAYSTFEELEEEEIRSEGFSDPTPDQLQPDDQSKSKATVVRRVPCKHKKKKSKCCRCKMKKEGQSEDKSKSLCQCPPIVIFDSPPSAKRNFFDFLKCLLPRSRRTTTKSPPSSGDKKLLCACGKEVQPFFGYAELEKRPSGYKKTVGQPSKKQAIEAKTSTEGRRQRSPKRLGAQSDKAKIEKKSQNKTQNSNTKKITPIIDVDEREGSLCNLQEHMAKLKAHGQQTPAKESNSKTPSQGYKRGHSTNQQAAIPKSSLEQPAGLSAISNNSKKIIHIVDVDQRVGQVAAKESHNKMTSQGSKSSASPKKIIPIVDVDEREGSLCNLQEHWARQGGILMNTNKSCSGGGGGGGAEENITTVTFRQCEQFGGFGATPMIASSFLIFQATYTCRFPQELRRYQLLFRERRFEDENTSRAIQTWILKAETRRSDSESHGKSRREDTSEDKQIRPYTHPYDLNAVFRLFEQHKRQQPEYRDRERKVLCKKLREKLSQRLSNQRTNRCQGFCVICFSYIGVYINIIVYIVIVLYSLLYVSMIR